ncbi:MAG TPA: DNA alkylation repair protein [Saprospiraceae bacterium]|nr:DNA alkylation repair protein [Saprospiraceae bacterium]
MTVENVLQSLKSLGSESTRKIFRNHGAPENMYGVKVGDLKGIIKTLPRKKDHELSLALYDSGNSDAMYLAGLIADEKKISPDDLRHWAEKASWYMISEYTVAWVAADSPHGWALALEWIESPVEQIASTGWSTLASWCTVRPDATLDLPALEKLLDRVANTIHNAPNRVRYTMNNFVIAAGICVLPLTEKAIATARAIGAVKVEMGGTACKVPDAESYIENARAKGRMGVKKKDARC